MPRRPQNMRLVLEIVDLLTIKEQLVWPLMVAASIRWEREDPWEEKGEGACIRCLMQ